MGYSCIGPHVMCLIFMIVQCKNSVSSEDNSRTDVLNSIRRDANILSNVNEAQDLNKADILEHLLQNGARGESFSKPSTEFMMKVFENLLGGDKLSAATGHTARRTQRQLGLVDTVRSFSAQGQGNDYVINIPALPEHETANFAEIRFSGHTNNKELSKYRVYVYEKPSQKLLHKFKLFPKTSTNKDPYVADITRKLLPHLNGLQRNVSVTIKRNNVDTTNTNKGLESIRPILVIYSQDKQFMKDFYNNYINTDNNNQETNRFKRQTIERSTGNKGRKRRKNRWRKNKNEKDICQLYDFKVDFDLIGWGPWIIHPKTFNSKVCYGRCPEPITGEFSPTNHAMLQQLMRMKRPLSAPEPCCVPTKLRPLSMLYFEFDDIVVRHHEDMIAAACGCR